MAQVPQTYKNHARFDPSFHFFLGPLAIFMLIGTIVELVRNPGWMSGAHVVAAVWALTATFKMRLYALKVQDRVIRLEERLRLREVLPASMEGRIADLREDQLIAIRFASDGEVADLVHKALAENWNNKQIKQAIRNWRPDYWRI